MNDKRKAYEEKLDAELKEWNAEIELLKAKAANVTAGMKIDYNETINVLQHKQTEVRKRLQELQAASDAAWEDLKIGLEKAWFEVRTAYQDAMSRFK
jgi:hypothetical protein